MNKQKLGALSANWEEDLVVFLIGARVRRRWKIHKWWPLVTAMPRMLRELEGNPELGYLGGEVWGGFSNIMVQYWKSREHLMHYAHLKEGAHLPVWRDFNKRIGSSDSVGIWHEIYQVPKGNAHTLYRGMPPFGLGRIAGTREARRPSAKPVPQARAA